MTVPVSLSPNQLSFLFLSTMKVDLTKDFAGAMLRYGLCRQVADVILSFTDDELLNLTKLSTHQTVMRAANGNSPIFWSDLKQALHNEDTTAINMTLILGLFGGVPPVAVA